MYASHGNLCSHKVLAEARRQTVSGVCTPYKDPESQVFAHVALERPAVPHVMISPLSPMLKFQRAIFFSKLARLPRK